MPFVADVVDGDDERMHAPEWCGVGRSVKQVEGGAPARSWQPVETPPQVRGQPRLRGKVGQARRQRARAGSDGDELEVRRNLETCARELVDVPAHSARRRTEGVSIDPDAERRAAHRVGYRALAANESFDRAARRSSSSERVGDPATSNGSPLSDIFT